MGEIICIHIGQAGVNIGQAFWKQLINDQNIDLNGFKIENKDCNTNIHKFYNQLINGKYVPRCLFIDPDKYTIDKLQQEELKNLFNKNLCISYKEGSSDNYGSGLLQGKTMKEQIEEKLIKISVECDQIWGFILFHSINGGSGSGIATVILQSLNTLFNKKYRISYTICPSPSYSSSIVECYNACFGIQKLSQDSDLNIMIQNEALYNIEEKVLDCELPSFTEINQIIAYSSANLLTSSEIQTLSTNLVPYPRINFTQQALSPLQAIDTHNNLNTTTIIKQAYDKQYCQFITSYYNQKNISCTHLFRGDINMIQAYDSLKLIMKIENSNIVSWSSAGSKIEYDSYLCKVPNYYNFKRPKRSCLLIKNAFSIVESFGFLSYYFDQIFHTRAFVHWYIGCGMEEEDFRECREQMSSLCKEYEDPETFYEMEAYGEDNANE